MKQAPTLKAVDGDQSTALIATGTLVVLVGAIANAIFAFLFNVLLVRSTNQADYGHLTVALTLVNTVVLVVSAGSSESIARFLAIFLQERDRSGAYSTMLYAIRWSIVAGLLFSAIVLVFADELGSLLGGPEVVLSIRFLIITVPLSALSLSLSGVLRAFGDSRAQVVFTNFLLAGLRTGLIGVVYLLHGDYYLALISVIASSAFSTLALTAYVVRRYVRHYVSIARPITRTIFSFGLPIGLQALAYSLNDWLIVLVLAYFRPPTEVASMGVAKSSAGYASLLLYASVFLYLPVASKLLVAGNLVVFRTMYQTITKWVFVLSLPLLMLLLLAPSNFLSVLYTDRYTSAAPLLRILAAAYGLNCLTGPNGHSLIALGRTGEATLVTVGSAVLGLLSSFILIPSFGDLGAVLALSASICIANVLMSALLYRFTLANPLSKEFLRFVPVSILLCAAAYLIVDGLVPTSIMQLLLLSASFGVATILSLFWTRSITLDDVSAVRHIETRIGHPGVISNRFHLAGSAQP